MKQSFLFALIINKYNKGSDNLMISYNLFVHNFVDNIQRECFSKVCLSNGYLIVPNNCYKL